MTFRLNSSIKLDAIYRIYAENVFLNLALIRRSLDNFHKQLLELKVAGVSETIPGDNVQYYGIIQIFRIQSVEIKVLNSLNEISRRSC